MKKFLIILGVVFVIIIAAIIVLPIIFKDDIQQALDETLDDSLNAKVFYDVDDFSLSLIKNFPDLTVSVGNFGVVGMDEFSEDTLASIASFEVTVDLMSAVSGDQIIVEEILLDQPKILVLVLEDGKANYDIAKPSEPSQPSEPSEETPVEEAEPEEVAAVEEPSSESDGGGMNIGIERWAIQDGEIIYKDLSMNFFTSLIGFNHEGSGDFSLDVFDLSTTTRIESVSLGFDGVEYLSNKTFEADLNLNMNLPEMQFTFLDNRVALNDFAIEAEGNVNMPGDDINMDIKFGGKGISLKGILSLIPGVYQEEYLAGVTAGGELNFGGLVKGTFNDNSMPKVSANLSVSDGTISYAEYNIPMEKINIETSFNYPSADLTQTSFNIDRFSMLVDGEKVEAYLKFKNLEDFNWDFGFEGNADLEKITKIVPLDGMTLKGKINAGLKTAGKMSDVEAERFDALPTSGSLSIDEFLFQSEDLPQGFEISKANLTFNPSQIALNQFDAKSGSSDFQLKGNVDNYLGFALKENELLTGTLTLTSNLLDLNEFMPEEEASETEQPVNEEEVVEEEEEVVVVAEESTTVDTTTTSSSAIKIPENIDFTMASSIKRISFTNLNMENFEGKVLIKDGAIILDRNTFNMLDGTFELTGSYETKDLDQPKYDFGFKIKDLSIAGAFESFGTVQQYVPIAKQVSGKFSTDLNVNGLLGGDMMPIMDKMNMAGLVNVAQATLTGGDFVNKLSAVASLKSGASASSSEKKISLKDVLIKTEIQDGRLFVEPFDLEANGQKATIGGSNTLDGQLDYTMQMQDIPTGAIGNALNSALSSFTGGKKLVSDKINLNLGIGGTYDDVKVKLLGTSNSSSGGSSSPSSVAKEKLNSKVNEEKAKAKEELAKKKEEQRKKIISEAESQAAKIRSQGKSSAEKVKKEGYAAADKLVKDAGSNPIKKRVAKEAAKKLRSEADKNAAKIEAEANKRADKLVADAKAKAAKI